MTVDTKKISESRKNEREATPTLELRQVRAIEDAADALEAIRIQLVLFAATYERLNRP